MARFISVEIDASQLRVAEIEEVGKKSEYFSASVSRCLRE